jgi:hypothetical protein
LNDARRPGDCRPPAPELARRSIISSSAAASASSLAVTVPGPCPPAVRGLPPGPPLHAAAAGDAARGATGDARPLPPPPCPPPPPRSCSRMRPFSCRSSSISRLSKLIWASFGSYCTVGRFWMFLVRVAYSSVLRVSST